MTEENTVDLIEVKNNYDHLIADEKNKHTVYCTKCPSKILTSTMGKHTIVDVILYTNKYQSEYKLCNIIIIYFCLV